jgi:hypothetical protein
MAEERQIPVSETEAQCGGFRAKPVAIGDFSAAKSSGESWTNERPET